MKRILLVLSALCLGCKTKVEQPKPQLTYEQKLNELGIYFGKKYLFDQPNEYPPSRDSIQFNADTSITESCYTVNLTYPISVKVSNFIAIEKLKLRPNSLMFFSDICHQNLFIYNVDKGWVMISNGKGIKLPNP